MTAARGIYIITICCVVFLGGLYLSVFNYSNAQSPVVDDAISKNISIKIPPPIEGLVFDAQRKAQSLDVDDIFVLSANGVKHRFNVELAITPSAQRRGMMFREYIVENTGMLFLFEEEAEHNFWMKNTFIPLDIIFIRKDGIIHHIHHMAEPRKMDRISSQGKVIAVLEIAGGEAEILGINVGDRVLYKVFSVFSVCDDPMDDC